jgi:hypothetical protein
MVKCIGRVTIEGNGILDEEIAASFKRIYGSANGITTENRSYRNIKKDVRQYNRIIKTCKTVSDLLVGTNCYSHQRFGFLAVNEVFLQKTKETRPELIAKCQCSCGNIVTAPLPALVDGSLIDCGCRAPLPPKYSARITVYQSETPIRWTTTVDGIQWLGNRYMWFVTLYDGSKCVLRKYTSKAEEALQLRKEAELKYFGRSDIRKYEEILLYELEQFRLAYIAKNPPKVEGIYYNKTEKLWNAKLRLHGEFVFDRSYKTREEAVGARLRAERQYFGEPLMAEEYYV